MPLMGPFDRFNDRAKRVLALSQDEAIRFGHDYIGPEHLLMGLVREGEGVAARALEQYVGLSKVRSTVEQHVPRVERETQPESIVLSPGTKKVIDFAIEEMRKLEHSHVGTEHLLLGLLRHAPEPETVVGEIFAALGVDPEKVRAEIVAILADPSRQRGPGGSGLGSAPTARSPFDRFDSSAKRSLALAQDEAVRFDHNYIGTEHLLTGILREGEGAGSRALQDLAVDLGRVRSALEFIIGRGVEPTPPSEITLSPRTKKIIELAVDEARTLGADRVGSGHLLLGLVREGQGIASGILESLGIDLQVVRKKTLELMPPRGDRATLLDAKGNKRDWYCEDVLSGKLKVEVLYEDERVLGIRHPYPVYEAHGVVIPKAHVPSLMTFDAADGQLLSSMIRGVQAVASALSLDKVGFRLEANSSAPGVTPHMHWHVAGPGLPPPQR